MKNLFTLLLIFSLSLRLNAQKQLSPKDSIATFYDQLFVALKKEYLHKNSINWAQVENETKQHLSAYPSFKSSLKEITTLFNRIGATHSKVYLQNEAYGATVNIPSKEHRSDQWNTKYAAKPSFETKILDGKYAYVLMPPMKFEDISSENIHRIAQPLYDQIAELKAQHNIEGWIIDLRINTGGNVYPMLLALYDLLGDNDIWGGLNADKKQVNKIKLANGKYLNNGKKVSYINPKGKPIDQAKVAIITSVMTASSGEVTAIAFKGRANTTFIGEKTMGMTTGNFLRVLPFDYKLILSIVYDCDRNGNYYEQLVPDTIISKQDNFDDLLLDKNILEAIKFISRK